MCFGGKKNYGILKTYELFDHNELSSLPYVSPHHHHHTHTEGAVFIGQETR